MWGRPQINSLTHYYMYMYVNEIASNVKQEKMEIISLCERRQKMSCTNLDFSLTRAVLTVFVCVWDVHIKYFIFYFLRDEMTAYIQRFPYMLACIYINYLRALSERGRTTFGHIFQDVRAGFLIIHFDYFILFVPRSVCNGMPFYVPLTGYKDSKKKKKTPHRQYINLQMFHQCDTETIYNNNQTIFFRHHHAGTIVKRYNYIDGGSYKNWQV